MSAPRVTLDQWRALQAVVEHGGYAQAAAVLHRSQSTLSYAVHSLETKLGLRLLQREGRNARITEAGALLLRRSRPLLEQAEQLEVLAASLAQGWEPEIRLVVDAAFPTELLLEALSQFLPEARGTRVRLREEVLSGVLEVLETEGAELAITDELPPGFLGDPIMELTFEALAHPGHALHGLGRGLRAGDLAREMQVVVGDSGSRRRRDVGWLGAENRWTVASMETAIETVRRGLGFAWLPRLRVAELMQRGELRALPLEEGRRYRVPLYLLFGKGPAAGPATKALARQLRAVVAKAVQR
jgi:DNA-binding transcriptional LysR family regulator